MELHDERGQRKYVTAEERERLLDAARGMDRAHRTFLMTLVFSGCRLSEALNLRTSQVDLDRRRLVFESLKKRRKGVYRAVPMPEHVIDALDLVHGVREALRRNRNERLWDMSRTTAWRVVRTAMAGADIRGPHASPKGLRHGYGVNAIASGVTLNMVQRWLGHAKMETTAIYADAMGEEELAIADRMWRPVAESGGGAST